MVEASVSIPQGATPCGITFWVPLSQAVMVQPWTLPVYGRQKTTYCFSPEHLTIAQEFNYKVTMSCKTTHPANRDSEASRSFVLVR